MLKDVEADVGHCLKCGACRLDWQTKEPICPSGIRFGFDSHYAIGRVALARAVLSGAWTIDRATAERVLTCTDCGGCDVQCNATIGVGPLRIIRELKREIVATGLVPAPVRRFLVNVTEWGNAFGRPQDTRGDWAAEIDAPRWHGHDYLFYVGDFGSFDERAQKVARTVAGLFDAAGLSWGILGPEEFCDGHDVAAVGDRDLFEALVEIGGEQIREKGIRRIVTLCPHALNGFREWRRLGVDIEPVHYTQLLAELLREGRLRPRRAPAGLVTFHDPCNLGRHGGEYAAPREILGYLPGVETIEMERHGEHGLCCGGGGGNAYADLLGTGPRTPSRVRVREALDTCAEALVSACVICRNMLEDATRSEDATGRLSVIEIADLVAASLVED